MNGLVLISSLDKHNHSINVTLLPTNLLSKQPFNHPNLFYQLNHSTNYAKPFLKPEHANNQRKTLT